VSRAAAAWDRFWFADAPATNLGVARILVAGHALWILLSRDPAAFSGLPAEFWRFVADTARWRFLLFEGHPLLERALQTAALVALGTAVLGLWPRVSCLVAGALLYHLAPLETINYTPSPWVKGYTITTLALVVLGASRCGDALVLRRAGARPPAWEYRWPLVLIQLALAQVYLFAGYAKMLRTGPSWVLDTVRGYTQLYTQNEEVAVFQALGTWLVAHPALCVVAGCVAMALNLTFWTVLFWRGARRVLVPFALAWHVAILLTMNIAFLEAPLLLLFVDWDRLRARLSAARAPAAAA
jgi:HTTM domain